MLVSAGYVTAFGFQLVAMALGGFVPNNLLELTSSPGRSSLLQRTQLVTLSGLALVGNGFLASRRRGAGRPLRR